MNETVTGAPAQRGTTLRTGTVVRAAERGATRVADRVVAKIAAQAAREALHAGPEADRLPRGRAAAPQASVVVRPPSGRGHRPGEARVSVQVALGYPSDIGAQCGAVRRQVALRVRELVGMEVPRVTVEVERLHSARPGGDVRGRVR